MSEKVNIKGISFVPSSDISADAKLKLDGMMKKKSENLIKLVAAYKAGTLIPQI